MNKPYDKNDNDTYLEILANTPARDVMLHMFRDSSGRVAEVTRDGVSINGHFTSESPSTARDNVLRFAPPKVTGLKLIKKILLETLLPMSLVHRYDLSAESLAHTQETPIFYDAKLEKFVVLLDNRFLRDVNLNELKLDNEIYPLMRESIAAYDPWHPTPGEPKNLGMLFDTLDAARQACTKDSPETVYGRLKHLYRTYRLLQSQGEKVIVIKGMSKFGQRAQILHGVSADASTHAVSTAAYNLEFVVAYKFGNQFYLITADGKLDQKKSFTLDKIKQQNPNPMHRTKDGDVLVVPYSDSQLAMLNMLAGKLNAFHEEILGFLRGSEQRDELLDAPLGAPASKNLLKQLLGPQA